MKLILPHWGLCFLKEVLENTKKNPHFGGFFLLGFKKLTEYVDMSG
jgi:hypothetical protein